MLDVGGRFKDVGGWCKDGGGGVKMWGGCKDVLLPAS